MLADKDHRGVYRELSKVLDGAWILVDSQGERGMDAKALGESMGLDCQHAADMTSALDRALMASAAGDVILIFGSFNAIEQSVWLRSNHDE
jgi:folylpolyglutamate synthase/dihydropteroate synthase